MYLCTACSMKVAFFHPQQKKLNPTFVIHYIFCVCVYRILSICFHTYMCFANFFLQSSVIMRHESIRIRRISMIDLFPHFQGPSLTSQCLAVRRPSLRLGCGADLQIWHDSGSGCNFKKVPAPEILKRQAPAPTFCQF